MTPNDIVQMRPTESGWRTIIKKVDDFNRYMQNVHPSVRFRQSLPQVDQNGYIKGQFWQLMRYFDWEDGIDCPFDDLREVPK